MKNQLEEELRLQTGGTQQELVERVQVTRQTIISVERGRFSPSLVLAFRFARQSEAAIEDLFLHSRTEDAIE